jgi:hypothetical protein
VPTNDINGFQPLTGVFEPSGIQQLADGRFLVIEDEKQHALSLLRISGGHVAHIALSAPFWSWGDGDFWNLDDLEGVTTDSAGNIYAITSHSRDSDGDTGKPRERLVRFRIEGDSVVDPKVVNSLKRDLMAAHPELAVSAAIRNVKSEGGLNIEALEMSPDQRQLLIGFRSPLLDERAIIASIENPGAIFDTDERPRIGARLTTLDLDGNGIRGISWVPSLAGYLLIAGPVAREKVKFQLWFWRGGSGDHPRRVTVAGLSGFEHAEGVSPAVIDGRQCIIIVSDDGNRDEKRFAQYLILQEDEVKIAD